MADFARFVRLWLHEHLQPLPDDCDLSVANWLQHSNYPLARRNELQAVWDMHGGVYSLPTLRACSGVASFIKRETYLDWKAARFINSRSDYAKCFFGPVSRAIENEVYKTWNFIKHTPVPDRPRVIAERLGTDGPYYETDYSSFECIFTREIMEACEFQLYEYMVQKVSNNRDGFDARMWCQGLREVIGGVNRCYGPGVAFKVECTRMSGEMFTSLGNGFTNLMLAEYTHHVLKYGAVSRSFTTLAGRHYSVGPQDCRSDFNGFVEGDDGIMVAKYPQSVLEDMFTSLGTIIKMKKHVTLDQCGFCGMVFDIETGVTIYDPLKFLNNFCFVDRPVGTSTKKLQVLLKAKALSFLFSYAGCPVIQTQAVAVLSKLDDITINWDDVYAISKGWQWDNYYCFAMEHEATWRSLIKPVADSARRVMAEQYGLPVDNQLKLEREIAGMDRILDPTYTFFTAHLFVDREEVVSQEYYSRAYTRVFPPGTTMALMEDAAWLA